MATLQNAYNTGRQAHAMHDKRTDNPYIGLAAHWDDGWVSRHREQLRADGKSITGIQTFKDLEETLPRLFQWREEVLREAQAFGYITTISGRRRMLPDLYSDEWYPRTRAERQCVASMVQGSSADIVRRCMNKARKEVDILAARMILQVHDEILWECGPAWDEDTFDRLQDICENGHGYDLNVPMKFEASTGVSWEDKDAQGARSYRVLERGI